MHLPRLLRTTLLAQRRIIEAVRDSGVTDDCLATHLSESGVPRRSRDLVTRWASDRDPRWMTVADLLGAMRISGETERVLQPLCDVAGGLFVQLHGAEGQPVTVRQALALGGLIGRLQEAVLDARHPDSDGGEEITAEERDALVEIIDEALRKLTAMRAGLAGRPREVA